LRSERNDTDRTVAVTAPERGTLSRTTFRPDVEGLRALAIGAVVAFHAGVPGISGGFVGVDIFFVISGFLITGMLHREMATTNALALARFYGGRARRLLPAAAVAGIATAAGAGAWLPPLEARRVLGDGIASALYVGNYRFAAQGTDYLAETAPPSPFQHYWSLAVEEQFYLLWPILILGTAWYLRRHRADTGAARPYLLALAAVAAISFALDLILTPLTPAWSFFGLPSRAWELAVGGLVALTAGRWRRLRSAPAAAAIGWFGLLLIVVACVHLGARTPYPGSAAMVPVAGTALVIAAGCVTTKSGVALLLSRPSLRAVGRLSYSWYLWHWPVLILAPAAIGHPLGLLGRLAAVSTAAGLAMLTMRLVENPIRFAPALRSSAGRSLAGGGIATLAAALSGVLLLGTVPAPVGHGAAASALAVGAPAAAPPDAKPADPRDTTIAQVQAAVAASADLGAIPSNLTPTLSDAPLDKASVFVDGCVRSWLDVGQPMCVFGDENSPTTVALVGDSHAAMWSPAFEQAAQQRHWRLETLAKVTCPLMDLPITSPYLGRDYSECVQWRGQIVDRLRTEHPRLIVVDMSRRYGGDFGFVSYDPAWIDGVHRLVAQLRSTGAAVLVLGAVPDPHTTVPVCLSGHLDNATACASSRAEGVDAAGVAAEQAATTSAGGQFADLTPLFCTTARCPLIIGNTLVFRDDNHITVSYARTLTPVMTALTDRALNQTPAGGAATPH
jgi:peptidoglycan/LPS O-acetylase OafA/YrhL